MEKIFRKTEFVSMFFFFFFFFYCRLVEIPVKKSVFILTILYFTNA